jgi:hypothetical protein
MTVHRLGFVLAVRAIAAPPVSMLGCVQATMIAPAVSHTACSPPDLLLSSSILRSAELDVTTPGAT